MVIFFDFRTARKRLLHLAGETVNFLVKLANVFFNCLVKCFIVTSELSFYNIIDFANMQEESFPSPDSIDQHRAMSFHVDEFAKFDNQ